jgi:hypothetical protein
LAALSETEFFERVFGSIFSEWHWFGYHFEKKLRGADSPFADAIIAACVDCESAVPGFAGRTIDALLATGGVEKHRPHYEQLLQLLSEVLIVRHLARHAWPQPAVFALEPTAPGSHKNPELTVQVDETLIAVEVKAPSLLAHQEARAEHEAQLVARSGYLEQVSSAVGGKDKVLLPRDNPVKDFLISADEKFAPFRAVAPGAFYGVLVIVWDDYIQEPLNSLIHPRAGLFTPNSFALGENGQPLAFSNVDGVVLVRHLHQFVRASREEPLGDAWPGVFDYGTREMFPPKAYVPNPSGQALPSFVVDAFEAILWSDLAGAEYSGASDVIFWIGLR